MSVSELSSLKKRMENVKTKLELELQQLQTVYYRKRSSEMLQSSRLSQTPLKGDALAPEDRSAAADMLFSQDPPAQSTVANAMSSIQARLTGGTS